MCRGTAVERHGMDTRDMSMNVAFGKAEHSARLRNINVIVSLPHADCSEQCCRDALLRVAEHCPVHETIETLKDVEFDIISGKN